MPLPEAEARERAAFALHLCAENDENGNPRRVFVVFDARGRFVEAIDEEFIGERALTERHPRFSSYETPEGYSYIQRFEVPVEEYERQLRRTPVEEGSR